MTQTAKRTGSGAAKRAAAGKRTGPTPKSFCPLFRALADPTRLQILELIAASGAGELCVCEIEPRFDLAQPTISHHLRLLREARLVTADRRGTWVYYALDVRTLSSIGAFTPLLMRSRRAPRGRASRTPGRRAATAI